MRENRTGIAGGGVSGVRTLVKIVAFAGLFSGCLPSGELPVRELSVGDALRNADSLRSQVPITTAEGFEVTLWASETLLEDPIGIDIDPYGRLYATVTTRRRGSMFDIRRHQQWETESLSWQSVEDRSRFLRREFATSRSDSNRWLEDRNGDGVHDWRDLTVQREKVYRIEDPGRIGTATRSERLIHDFHRKESDVAGTVLWDRGDLLVGVAPDLWRFRESRRGYRGESISHGFGVRIGYGGHGISGLRRGPDGRIYWAVGDIGYSVTDSEGRLWHGPNEGAIFRSEPDGSGFEVFATGLRNAHEFDFDRYGNLITVDNDGDHEGEYERLVHLIDGSDSGWRIHWQFGKYDDPLNNGYNVWMEEGYYRPYFEGQAIHLLPPLARYHSGPSGLVYNPGTALGEQWNDHFFVGEFTGTPARSGIHAFRLEAAGSTFRLAEDRRLMNGVLVTSLRFGPDGALYISDWVEGWATDGRGRIWKMDVSGDSKNSLRQETSEKLAGSLSGLTVGELRHLLANADMRVRMAAQFELVDRKAVAPLLETASKGETIPRLHALWALGQLSRTGIAEPGDLLFLLDDPDPELRAQAAVVIGEAGYGEAFEILAGLLEDGSARVQLHALQSLGRLQADEAFTPVMELIRRNGSGDPHLRHAALIALSRFAPADSLASLVNDPSVTARRVAVAALGRTGDSSAALFLEDSDSDVVADAARAINDDSMIEEALPALASLLERENLRSEPVIRRAINASLYSGRREDAQRLLATAHRGDLDESLRVEAIRALSGWNGGSLLDRVSGRYRGERTAEPFPDDRGSRPLILQLVSDSSPEIRRVSARMIAGLGLLSHEDTLFELLESDPDPGVRISALQSIAELHSESVEDAFMIALADPESLLRSEALELMGDSLPDPGALDVLLEPVLKTGTVRERQRALDLAGRVGGESARKLLSAELERFVAGEAEPETELELFEAIGSAGGDELVQRLERHLSSEESRGEDFRFEYMLYGGDAGTGRSIFYENAAAECMRCHAVGGSGDEPGPDLAGVGSRLGRVELLESLLDPSARITPGYGAVTLRLRNGEVIIGIFEGEDETSLTVARDGRLEKVGRNDILERIDAPSAMPPTAERLDARQIRDLVEFLSTLTD